VADKLAKLGSSWDTVPPGVFMQELHKSSISKALSKTSKTTESIDIITKPMDDKPESSKVMTFHVDWCTPFMTYFKTGAFQRIRMNENDYGNEHDTIP
jgi:hypothetical protein